MIFRKRYFELLFMVLASVAGIFSVSTVIYVDRDVTPDSARFGWVKDSGVPADAPQFALSGPVESSEGAVVKLWDYSRAINGGKHFPTFRQAIGDCVANGLANGLNYGQAADIYFGRRRATEFRPVDRPWLYGVSRTDREIGNGRLGSSDGSVGNWAVRAAQLRGVLAADEPGVPEYSGERARDWGINGVPDQYKWLAALHKLRSFALVKSYEDVRDSLANSYPVTIASNVGFQMQAVVKDGKHWGRPSGSWAHQMCLIAIDDKAISPFDGSKGAAYCLNSWGENAHGKPADDAPPGGFWIDRTTINRIVKQGDSWALGGFDGFPARPRPDQFIVFDPGVDVDFVESDPLVATSVCEVAGLSNQDARSCAIGLGFVSLLAGAHCWRRSILRRRSEYRGILNNLSA